MNRQQQPRRRRPVNRRRARVAPRPPRAMVITRPDLLVQRRLIQQNFTVGLNNILTASNSNYGNTTFTWSGASLENFSTISNSYEQYRISHVSVYAGPAQSPLGPEQTVADTMTTLVTTAVDLDSSNTSSLTGTDIRKFTNARTVALGSRMKKIADFRPRLNNMYQPKIVFSPNHWLDTGDQSSLFRGLRFFVENPGGAKSYDDPSQQQKVYVICKVTLELRGRKSANIAYSDVLNHEDVTNEPTLNPPVYDLTDTEDNLRINLLNGTYFPIDMLGISIGNIGTSITGNALIGIKFRIQSTMVEYLIVHAEGGSYNANVNN